jgi:hypothetical protein
MTYRIKELGTAFVVAANGQDILICADFTVAEKATIDAENGPHESLMVLPRKKFERAQLKKSVQTLSLSAGPSR